MWFFLTCGRTLGVPLECRRMCQGSSWVASKLSRTLSRLKSEDGISLQRHSGKGPHLTLRGESPGFSRVAPENLGFLSGYYLDFRDRLVLPQEGQVSRRVARGLSGFLSSQCRVLGPHLEVRPEHRVPLQCFHGSWGSYGVSTRESGHVSCGDMRVCFSL